MSTKNRFEKSRQLARPLSPARHALRTYWPAILVIQACALAVVLGYYWIEGAGDLFARIGELKARGGLLFAAASTVFSGGVFPELLKRLLRPEDSLQPGGKELAHQFIMWACLGIMVDLFYQLQTRLFGEGVGAWPLVPKLCVDQLIFTPLIALPFITIWFLLYEKDYKIKAWLQAISLPRLTARVLPLWATSLSFWPVMLLIIYSLPSLLQFPLFLFGNAAFSILMIYIIRRQNEPAT
jgi:hypothetical protein